MHKNRVNSPYGHMHLKRSVHRNICRESFKNNEKTDFDLPLSSIFILTPGLLRTYICFLLTFSLNSGMSALIFYLIFHEISQTEELGGSAMWETVLGGPSKIFEIFGITSIFKRPR